MHTRRPLLHLWLFLLECLRPFLRVLSRHRLHLALMRLKLARAVLCSLQCLRLDLLANLRACQPRSLSRSPRPTRQRLVQILGHRQQGPFARQLPCPVLTGPMTLVRMFLRPLPCRRTFPSTSLRSSARAIEVRLQHQLQRRRLQISKHSSHRSFRIQHRIKCPRWHRLFPSTNRRAPRLKLTSIRCPSQSHSTR